MTANLFVQCRIFVLCAIAAFVAPMLQAQTVHSFAPFGGTGGSPFTARCSQGEVLTGLDLWTGDDVDAIRPVCLSIATGQTQDHRFRFGGNSGTHQRLICPATAPVVLAMYVGAEGSTTVVNNIHLTCGPSAPNARSEYTSVAYDGPPYGGGTGILTTFHPEPEHESQACPGGLAGAGIVGRSGIWLDALGLICDELPPVAAPLPAPQRPVVRAQARVKPLPDISALHARGVAIALANEDPVATKLRSEQAEGPARRGFDIGMAAAEGQTSDGPGKKAIRDALNPAERDAFSVAVTYTTSRNRKRITDLAPRGEVLSREDPLTVLLRSQQVDSSARLGFDIGMAAAERQTADGPGKQAVHDGLRLEEQKGFAAAVAFSIARNRNAPLAATGAAIALADPVVGTVRNSEVDPFFRLGFDIASGIFGDPARGARGNTATGSGSDAIRDALNAAGQRGFRAAVALHLSRKYGR